jgi:hypothetical protein
VNALAARRDAKLLPTFPRILRASLAIRHFEDDIVIHNHRFNLLVLFCWCFSALDTINAT